MDATLLIFIGTLAVYIPLASLLVYVWAKHGKGDRGVVMARSLFLLGSLALIWYMIIL
ncbi:MAG: hypothetical protein RIQ41_302 [Candidatus Parcubacteria bacterium]|jgi:hypothetical protein